MILIYTSLVIVTLQHCYTHNEILVISLYTMTVLPGSIYSVLRSGRICLPFTNWHIPHTSMDGLLVSQRTATSVAPPPSTIWHRYLQILESFGPFGDECWLTFHASMWWLLDLFFLSPLSKYFIFNWKVLQKVASDGQNET